MTNGSNDNEDSVLENLDRPISNDDAVQDCGWEGFILFETDEMTGQVFAFFMTDERLMELLAWRQSQGYLEAA